jgi:predicted  nucleic acid-binding Zn-ribbon protein
MNQQLEQVTTSLEEETLPLPLPKLAAAREKVLWMRGNARKTSSEAYRVKHRIDTLVARQKALTEARAQVETVEELRTLKAELVDVEDHLEVLQRTLTPLERSATALTASLRQDEEAYRMVHTEALEALQVAKMYWQRGRDERDKVRSLRTLDELVGAGQGSQYVTSLEKPPFPQEAGWITARTVLS